MMTYTLSKYMDAKNYFFTREGFEVESVYSDSTGVVVGVPMRRADRDAFKLDLDNPEQRLHGYHMARAVHPLRSEWRSTDEPRPS